MRLTRLQKSLWAAAGIAMLGYGTMFLIADRLPAPVVEAPFRPTFALPDAEGRLRTPTEFGGKHILVFFGFTNCPDVCPTTLADVAQVMDDLGDEAAANTRDLNDKAAAVGKGAADATKGAVDVVTKSRVMAGRERCVTAPNGAPDCVAAAEQLCRKHGYATGKSMDFTSAEECPAKAYLNGTTGGAECYTVTFISRAMCQ